MPTISSHKAIAGAGANIRGSEEKDLGDKRRQMLERVDKLVFQALDRLDSEMGRLPLRSMPVMLAILIDKRQALEGSSMPTVQNNTVILNGFGREAALAALGVGGNRGGVGNGPSSPDRPARQLEGVSGAVALDLEPVSAQVQLQALPDAPATDLPAIAHKRARILVNNSGPSSGA